MKKKNMRLMMIRKERIILALILSSISILAIFDLSRDMTEGVIWWHVVIEASTAIVGLIGVFFIVRGQFTLRHNLEYEKKISADLEEESRRWRMRSKKYLEGLSQSIDDQLNHWNLTNSEKEVAFLLLKGFSLKEIALLRKTTEKTARAQSTAIYSKAGVTGRSQLSAFFLEDLLLPQISEKSQKF